MSRSRMVESFLMIWALAVWILPFWSFICSYISPSLSQIGSRASSEIFCSFWYLAFEEWYCFLQNCSSLFIDSMSSLMNSMLFPSGAVFWQIDWIIDLTKSSSFSLRSPVLEITFSLPLPAFGFFFPTLPREILFSASPRSSCCFSASFSFFTSYSPSSISFFTSLLYSAFFFGFYSLTGGSSSLGSTGSGAFSTLFFDCCCDYLGSGFLVFVADGGRYIFFFSCFTSAGSSAGCSAPPPPSTFFTQGSEDLPLVAHL